MRKKNIFTETLFDDIRKDEKRTLWSFAKEIDMNFKEGKDIVNQVTEVLKTTMYYFKMFTQDEIVEIFPRVLSALNFPEACYPGEQWIRMQMNYIKKMKKLGRFYEMKRK